MTDPALPATPDPDDKDWTWVLERPCPECGFVADDVPVAELGGRIRATVVAWQQVLTRPDVRARPAATVWSPLEYGCHVRDVYRVITARAELMLTQEDPLFPNWDQDETALVERYWESDPKQVSAELTAAGTRLAEVLDGVQVDQWDRPGRRSNGSVFTVASLGRYGLHDVVHHLYDVGHGRD